MKNFKKTTKFGNVLLLQISTDIVASGIVGTIVGLSLDKMLDTKPILLIICLLLSMIACFRLIYRYIK